MPPIQAPISGFFASSFIFILGFCCFPFFLKALRTFHITNIPCVFLDTVCGHTKAQCPLALAQALSKIRCKFWVKVSSTCQTAHVYGTAVPGKKKSQNTVSKDTTMISEVTHWEGHKLSWWVPKLSALSALCHYCRWWKIQLKSHQVEKLMPLVKDCSFTF